MRANIPMFVTGTVTHAAGWGAWFLWSWCNQLADINNHQNYHWAAMPHGVLAMVMLIGGAVLTAFSFDSSFNKGKS